MELTTEVGTPTAAAVTAPATTPAASPVSKSGTRRATTRRYVMCPPRHFDVTYRINPWMHPEKPTDQGVAMVQWQRVHDALIELGHSVELVEPTAGLPDMVFAANGATAYGDRALVARFRFGQRDDESPAYLEWFAQHGFEVRQSEFTNEGEGDFLPVGPWILAGTGFRTDRRAHGESEEFFGRPVIGLTLVKDRFYHLDTALSVLDDQTVMYYPAAFSPGSRAMLRELFPTAIIATDEDADAFGLNAVSDGRNVVLPAGATKLAARLRDAGFETTGIDVSELLRAGGGVKCCILEVHGPEAVR